MKLPLESPRERSLAAGLLIFWALAFLPNLRTSPNWYGDEGEWMEMCWTFIQGRPTVGPVLNDHVFPYPYPPLYELINGGLLQIFGNDLLVSRALGAGIALVTAGILVWVGSRLRGRTFGFMCAGAFLVYSEAVINFRWVRSHPMAGMWALACTGFLIRYVQEKRLRDAVWAGVMCALATATNYFTYPLIGAVVLTVAGVNWREWKSARAWSHVVVAGAVACAYAAGFVLWYVLMQGGWEHLMSQVHRLTSVASNEVRPTIAGEAERFVKNVWTLGFRTPTQMGPRGWEGRDWWLVVATLGFVFLPVTKGKWLRAWVPFWLLVLMFGVFKKLNNVPLFFYPAMVFLPLMAIGFAGVVTWVSEFIERKVKGAGIVVAIGCLVPWAMITLPGAWGHFTTKIDMWTQHSVTQAEAAMKYVNAHTTSNDFVVVPKQIYWLVDTPRKSMLTHCWSYEGHTNDMWGTVIPRDMYWFDCRWQNAKYVVLAMGVDPQTQQPRGIDIVYTIGLHGMKEIISQIAAEKWPVVYGGGQGVAYAPVGPNMVVPVAVGGEYLVLANPRFQKAAEK